MPNPLQQLHDFGQSFWYDNIRRELLKNGELARMVREDGLRGLTSNPTIFAKALSGGSDYDADIFKNWSQPAGQLFIGLMADDIQGACDVLRPVYDSSKMTDGFASIEVFPDLARDMQGTLEQARMLWTKVARPNVMVKIPSTPECIPAIHAALSEGININITLMFGFDSYRDVVEAYLTALEKRVAQAQPINQLASVASLFVSRVDTKVDPRLEADPELQGKAGIANARRMYRHFQQQFSGARWEKLKAKGAQPQRLLWASTSTKNPKYPDTLYADALIGPYTVDTMPDQTVAAFRDHGHPADRLNEAMASYATEVQAVLDALAKAGIDMDQVSRELQDEGVASFEKSYVELIRGLANKIASRVWQKDTSFWTSDPAAAKIVGNRLGWLAILRTMRAATTDLVAFADQCKRKGLTDAVLLGMGGSSLAPEVFAQTFDHETGLAVHVLDTTDPDQIADLEARLKLKNTLFIVSSKSGGTIEPNSLFAYFWSKLADGDHYIAITDAGTSLEALAKEHKFCRVFTNPGDIGGRYSALSYFGLVPAALQGVDIARLLKAVDETNTTAEGLSLGITIGRYALQGRDKLTFLTHPELQSLGLWLEQLIAESTGKQGKGIVPIAGEAIGPASVYGSDRLFVRIGIGDSFPAAPDGSPSVKIPMRDRYDLGREFFRWEFATAAAGAVLGINPFDEPNVQESKENTVRVLAEAKPEAAPPAFDLKAWSAAIRPGDYIALMAYLERTDEIEGLLEEIRIALRDRHKVATTVGFGPRFLHSTGQLHKGGPNTGVFLQFTYTPKRDLPIPGKKFSFATLLAAQATGDYQSLVQHQRRVGRVALAGDAAAGLRQFLRTL
ncbi:MAG TPA: transaldolase [Terriglobales bacterium]